MSPRAAHLDAASARLLYLIREFDARDGWNNGHRSCAHWLAWRVGLDLGAARGRVRVARALGTLPRLSQALAHGELSYAKVRALTRVATPETEERLLAFGRVGTADHIERDEDATVVVRGRLTPEIGAVVMQALTAARETLHQRTRLNDPVGAPPTMEQQQADALALVAETALHHGVDPGAPGERYQVVVHVDAAALADPDQSGQSVHEDGQHVPAETSHRRRATPAEW